jgi:hypothetical protein
MIDLKKFRPTPHPTRKIFRRHGIPLSAVSQAVGKSYGYLSNILAGNQPATPEVDAKLRELAASLEEEAA